MQNTKKSIQQLSDNKRINKLPISQCKQVKGGEGIIIVLDDTQF